MIYILETLFEMCVHVFINKIVRQYLDLILYHFRQIIQTTIYNMIKAQFSLSKSRINEYLRICKLVFFYFNCLICGKQHTFRLASFYLMRNTDRVMTMIYTGYIPSIFKI